MPSRIVIAAAATLACVGAASSAVAAVAADTSATGASARDARVVGRFSMDGVVTVAVNVRGEQPGESVYRVWTINSLGCHGGSVCNRLLVTRNRGPVRGSFVVLHRTGPGEYSGRGVFWVPLTCLGRTYPLGSRAPYTITLRVGSGTMVGNVRYATTVSAVYTNRSRSDGTPCPLGPAEDAARYLGTLTSALPKPPAQPPRTTTTPPPTTTAPPPTS